MKSCSAINRSTETRVIVFSVFRAWNTLAQSLLISFSCFFFWYQEKYKIYATTVFINWGSVTVHLEWHQGLFCGHPMALHSYLFHCNCLLVCVCFVFGHGLR